VSLTACGSHAAVTEPRAPAAREVPEPWFAEAVWELDEDTSLVVRAMGPSTAAEYDLARHFDPCFEIHAGERECRTRGELPTEVARLTLLSLEGNTCEAAVEAAARLVFRERPYDDEAPWEYREVVGYRLRGCRGDGTVALHAPAEILLPPARDTMGPLPEPLRSQLGTDPECGPLGVAFPPLGTFAAFEGEPGTCWEQVLVGTSGAENRYDAIDAFVRLGDEWFVVFETVSEGPLVNAVRR